MLAKYLIRLDDAHPRFNRDKWNKLEIILKSNKIHPIVAIIPENRDKTLNYNLPDNNFWTKVKKWEQNNWIIALHGYRHTYHTINKNSSLLPLYTRSEFSELSLDLQIKKIRSSYSIFQKYKVLPQVFIAPSHTFDANTLRALEKVTNIKIISDGWSLFPIFQKNFLFIPQQLWEFKFKLFGVWTVCLHPDTMNENDFQNLDKKLKKFKRNIISLHDLNLQSKRKKKFYDALFYYFFVYKLKIKKRLNLN